MANTSDKEMADVRIRMSDGRPVMPDRAAQHDPAPDKVTFEMVRNDPEVAALIEQSNANLGVMGYSEHGVRHVTLVARIAINILKHLGYDGQLQELAGIAGYLHDIGNAINRYDHSLTGSLLARDVLVRMGMPPADVAIIMAAIGSHGDDSGRLGEPVHVVSAALILADKSDVHRSRVRNPDRATFDAHDRVNHAATSSFLRVDDEARTITLELTIDTSVAQMMHYFEIFLPRMLMSRRAAEFLGCAFHIEINEVELL